MDRLLFQSLAAAKSQGTVRAQLTNDLANTSTPGFKKSFDHVLLSSVKITADYGYETRYQPIVQSANIIDLKSGPQIQTGRLMDISMQEKTVLGAITADGQVAFTRRGDLRVLGDGTIALGNGLSVAGDDGAPIQAPIGANVYISNDGRILASLPEEPEGEQIPVGQLLLRDASEEVLIRRSDGLYEPRGRNGQGGDFEDGPNPISISIGALEGSNVNPIEAMVRLIDFSRSFEAQVNVLKETKDNDKSGATMMRMS